jgi:redox-sensitive bicupin YhaK (pirin superfamily)
MSKNKETGSSLKVKGISHRTMGTSHGHITRLVSPSDVGEMIKPFVFLDSFASDPAVGPNFGFHPHSGIATVTLIFSGEYNYEETTGAEGVLSAGSVEFMRASGGVWHNGRPLGTELIKGFQLWLALPPELESAASTSQYLAADEVVSEGPSRVIIGQHGGVSSPLPAPPGINYLDVQLNDGEEWTYRLPDDHEVSWLALHDGQLKVPDLLEERELVVFGESGREVRVQAVGKTRFILGSAVKHKHELVLGRNSVHTSREALASGVQEIKRIGEELRLAGRL